MLINIFKYYSNEEDVRLLLLFYSEYNSEYNTD